MKKTLFLLLTATLAGNSYALTQDDISPQNYPEAFNASTCVKASYNIEESTFTSNGYSSAGKFRMAMFDKLGKGKYAPNGSYVVANFNAYVATQGQQKASKFLWDNFNCNSLL